MSIFGWSYPPGAANDPNAPYNQTDDYGEDIAKVEQLLRERSTNRWKWDRITCCLSDKDGDLMSTGQQGLEIYSADDETINGTSYIGATIGRDLESLNLREELSEDAMERLADAYNDAVTLRCSDCMLDISSSDSDEIYLFQAVPFQAAWKFKPSSDGATDDIDYEATTDAVIAAAEAALKAYEDSLVELHKELDQLSGWANADGSECSEGMPGDCFIGHSLTPPVS